METKFSFPQDHRFSHYIKSTTSNKYVLIKWKFSTAYDIKSNSHANGFYYLPFAAITHRGYEIDENLPQNQNSLFTSVLFASTRNSQLYLQPDTERISH